MVRIKYVIGTFLIILGILTNRIFLEKFISPYAIVELNYRIPVILINLILIILGLFLIALKKEHFLPDKILNNYKFIAIIFFSVFLLFAFINVLMYGYQVIRDIGFYKDQIFFSYNKPLEKIYPTLMGREVNLLLYETWSRPYVYEPYTQFKERPFKGKYVNVHKAGFRITKDQGPWPPDPQNLNIFLFGGSTVFNYGVPDNQTIASCLQEIISSKSPAIGPASTRRLGEAGEARQGRQKPKAKSYVYNFGRGNYFSSQEKILFQELLTSGFVPDLAIFIDGLNDFYYFDNEPLFTGRLKKFVDNKGKTLLVDLPLVNIIKDIKKVADVQHDKGNERYNDKELLEKVIKRYVVNKKLIESNALAFNVKTLFVWQPVPTYKYDLKYHIFSGKGFGKFLYSKYGYAYMGDYVKKNNMGKNFLWLADSQENVKKPLYVDIDHYSAELSEDIAKRIYNFLIGSGVYDTR